MRILCIAVHLQASLQKRRDGLIFLDFELVIVKKILAIG